jgi:hypothetical protein
MPSEALVVKRTSMGGPLRTDPAKELDPASKAALKRARMNLAKALAHPDVRAALREQREAVERDRQHRAAKKRA